MGATAARRKRETGAMRRNDGHRAVSTGPDGPASLRAMRRAIVLLALLSASPAAADRSAYPALAPRSAEASLTGVARLRGADRTQNGCTAVLIAPDVALTAGHCARGEVSGPQAMQLHFRPDLTPPAFRVTVRAVAFHEAFTDDAPTPGNMRGDLALLRLAMPVPAEVATPVPLSDGAEADLVAIYGFANGEDGAGAEVLRGHPGCELAPLGPGLLGSDCRVVSGFSGGPVLSGGPGDWRLEGITIAAANGSAPLRAAIADLTPWPRFAGPYALQAPP
jgi:protease YdgD